MKLVVATRLPGSANGELRVITLTGTSHRELIHRAITMVGDQKLAWMRLERDPEDEQPTVVEPAE